MLELDDLKPWKAFWFSHEIRQSLVSVRIISFWQKYRILEANMFITSHSKIHNIVERNPRCPDDTWWRSHGHTHTSLTRTSQAWSSRGGGRRTWWPRCWSWGCGAARCGPARSHWSSSHWVLCQCTSGPHPHPVGQDRWRRWKVYCNKDSHYVMYEQLLTYPVDWMLNLSWTSPMLNLWPSIVHRLTPHLSGSPLASWGM